MIEALRPPEKRPAMPTFGSVGDARSNNFDFLRFFLAVLVIFSHSYPLLLATNDREVFFRLTHGQATGGGLAVDGFFIISGFLIAGSWMHSKGIGSYFQKRTLRIFPGLAVALLFCVLIVGPLGGADLTTYFTDPNTYRFLETLLLHQLVHELPGVFATNPFPRVVNSSIWTIQFEFLCYVMVALLGLLGFYRRRGLLLLLFLVVFACNHYCTWHSVAWQGRVSLWWFGDAWPLLRFSCYFLAGMLFYFYRAVIPRSRILLAVCLAALLAGCFGRLGLVEPICSTYVLFYAAFSPTFRAQRFGRYGDFSYGIYLYAWPVQQLLVQHFGQHLNPATLFLLALPISCGLAALSWHLVEKPCLRLKNQPWPKRAGHQRRLRERPSEQASP